MGRLRLKTKLRQNSICCRDFEAVKPAARRAFFLRELRAEMKRPVIDAFLDDLGGEAVGSRLQGVAVADGGKAVVGLGEGDAPLFHATGDELVAIDICGDREGEEGAHAEQHRAENLVVDVEVVVPVETALGAKDHVVGVRSRILRRGEAEARSTLLAHHRVVGPEVPGALAAPKKGPDDLLLALALRRPDQGDAVVGGVGGD